MAPVERIDPPRFVNQATRLLATGNLFLQLKPEYGAKELGNHVFSLWVPDQLRPDSKTPTVDTHVDYFVSPGDSPNEVKITVDRKRVDRQAEIPVLKVEETENFEAGLRRVSGIMYRNFLKRLKRTPEQKRRDDLQTMFNSVLLVHERREIILNSGDAAQGRLTVLQHDLVSGISNAVEVDLSVNNDPSNEANRFLGEVEFNLLSSLTQRSRQLNQSTLTAISTTLQAEIDQVHEDYRKSF